MENSKELLLVHRDIKPVTLSTPVNIMLTPQFYTLKKEVLPVKYAYQAKRLAHSLFEGLLEKEGSYDFLVYQEGESWTFLAYDIEKISEFLQVKGFRQGDVSKIFFAQQSVGMFTNPCVLNEKDALAVFDDKVVLVPVKALGTEASSPVHFDKRFTPKNGVTLEGASGSLFTTKQTILLSAIFVLFAMMFFLEGSRYGEEGQSSTEELQSLYDSYPALQSVYTREGIVSKYRDIDKLERAKRDAVKRLSGMIFKGVTLTSLAVNQKNVKATFSCSSKKIAQRVEKLGREADFAVSKEKSGHTLHMEGAL